MKKLLTLVFVSVLAMNLFAQDNGTLDTSFGTDGIFRFAPSESHDFMERLLIQSDGKILTMGRTRTDKSNYELYVSRHNTDGSLDLTFADNGIFRHKVDPLAYLNDLKDAALGANGLIYLTGHIFDNTNNKSYILCLDENGFIFPMFGDNGLVLSEYGGGIVYDCIDIDNMGRPVVAGYLNDIIIVRRFDESGNPDMTFGESGTVNIPIENSSYTYAYGLDIAEDNKIILVGERVDDTTGIRRGCVVKLKSNGTLDNSFGKGGVVNVNVGELVEFPQAITIQPDGKYLVVGHDEIYTEGNVPRYETFLLRLNAEDGTRDESFGTDGCIKLEPFEGEGCVNNSYVAPVVASDGQIFGALDSYNHNTLASRGYVYNLDAFGQFNESFAGTGMLPMNLQGGDVEINLASAAMQEDNKLIVGGYVYVNDGWSTEILLARINTEISETSANVGIEVNEITSNSISVDITPNENTVEYHAMIVSKEIFVQTEESAFLEELKADGKPLTDAQNVVFENLLSNTEYVVMVAAKNAVDEWVLKKVDTATLKGDAINEMNDAKLNVYPNPASSTVFVETTMNNAQIDIIDLTGRCVKSVKLTDNISSININDIENGVYFITIQDAGNRIVEKLIVR